MTETAERIVLASRPVGEPTPDNFRLEEFPIPQPEPGQMLLRTLWLSLDPYMRGRMSDAPSYAKPVGIGDVMEGGTFSEVMPRTSPGSPRAISL
jgi:NADPH-dependent curcumin reductase